MGARRRGAPVRSVPRGRADAVSDPDARGAFVGLSLRHDRGALWRAMLEGVAFGLADSLQLLQDLGAAPVAGRVSGGGARSRLWLRIVASALRLPLELTESEEGSAYGAALLAGVRDGVFADAEDAVARCVRVRETIEPDVGLRAGLRPLPPPVLDPATTGGLDMSILEGKTAVITGASRGIGAAIARQLHERGANLGLASRSGDDLGLERVVARPCDVRDLDALVELCAATAERFGGIDIVVPNAGVGAYGPFLDLSREHLDEMLDVNLKGTVYAIRAALPHMLGREGDVVTLASEAGRRGFPNEAVYCASKFGQVGLTRALDGELREHGIRCTNICPGGVATDFALDDGRGRSTRRPAGDDDRGGRGRGGRLRARTAAALPHPRDGAPPDDGGLLGVARDGSPPSSRRSSGTATASCASS